MNAALISRRKASILVLVIGIAYFLAASAGFYMIIHGGREARIDIWMNTEASLDGDNESKSADIRRWNVHPLCIASDEFAAAQQPRGVQFWDYIKQEAPGIFKYARLHNIFTSSAGDRRGEANAGGDVVQQHPNGTIFYNWTKVNDLYDNITSAGITPFVEIGFMPVLLSRISDPGNKPERRLPGNFTEWRNLIRAFLHHVGNRYGNETIKEWRFEVWNEPDAGSFWSDEDNDYMRLYNETASEIKTFSPELRVGGPAIANDYDFFERFLEFCSTNDVPLDFISFHAKGGHGGEIFPSHETLVGKVRKYVSIIKTFPEYDQRGDGTEYFLTEADPIVGSHKNKIERPEFAFRDTEYYPAWYVNTLVQLVQLQLELDASIHGMFSHNILFPWEVKTFHGTRGFLTPLFSATDTIETSIPGDMPLEPSTGVLGKPIFTGAQLVGKIPWNQSLLLETKVTGRCARFNMINALGFKILDGRILVLIAHQEEIQDARTTRIASVNIELDETPLSPVEVKEWRIDASDNNAFRIWENMGEPERLNPQQVADLQDVARLSSTSSTMVETEGRTLHLDITLEPYTTLLLECFP
ncbi:hypothetical protein GF325_00720 [Candidatus Bathyarchaeota archaeon]|nr:hypothetical protein [Candidatus Bathyarchaeota archaeon]